MGLFSKAIVNIFKSVGLSISRHKNPKKITTTIDAESNRIKEVLDLEAFSIKTNLIPGMIANESGKFLYLLCCSQQLSGDVAEIGSWQGKSTVFLAQAIKDSKNGNLFAIDHFKGNPGKEKNYEVDGTTLGLKEKFEKNIRSMNLQDYVTTLDMTNEEASRRFERDSIRMLFIDGDHTSEGVKKDIELFFPLLKKNAIVVFDDYTNSNLCGVVENVDKAIETYKPSRTFKYNNTFVMIL